MSATYYNTATFDIARDRNLGVECFGTAYRGTGFRYWVAVRGKPRMKEFPTAADALAFCDGIINRDKGHEHDMEMLYREQLRADVSADEVDEEFRFQREALDAEQPDADAHEWSGY